MQYFLKAAFLILAAITFNTKMKAQNSDQEYKKEWSAIAKHIENRLPKSALEGCKAILKQARAKKQAAQIIRALGYITTLENEVKEANELQSIKELEAEAKLLAAPAKNILYSILANRYAAYFGQNKWVIMRRNREAALKTDDIALWAADDFYRKINQLFALSLHNDALLKATPIGHFDVILIKGKDRRLRPTVYDFIAHNALDYYKTGESESTNAASAFAIREAAAYTNAAAFIKHRFITGDTASSKLKALQLFQQLMAFHINDKQLDALAELDVERIRFVNQGSVLPNKEALYLAALNKMTNAYEGYESADQIWYYIASIYNNRGNAYNVFSDTANRFAKLKAKEICDKVLAKKNKTKGYSDCFELSQSIIAKDIRLEVEQVNLPNEPFRALVEYANIGKLYIRLIKIDGNSNLEKAVDAEKWDKWLKAQYVKSWEQPLPNTNDYQKHRVEIKIDALPVGKYALLISHSSAFDKNSLMGLSRFYVSGLGFVNTANHFYVLNRSSGRPIENAQVKIWERENYYQGDKTGLKKIHEFKTDKNGYGLIKAQKEKGEQYRNNGFLYEISHGNDQLFIQENYSYMRFDDAIEEDVKPEHTMAKFFTDRTLYRPGQKIMFKGVVVASGSGIKNKVEANKSFTVWLYNPQHVKVDSLIVASNDFGSFSGAFNLPSTGLTGMFYLKLDGDYGTEYISVEEYKRPKFFVKIEETKQAYRFYDSIAVRGHAVAFAGNNITNASVVYRVKRRTRWIHYRASFYGHRPTYGKEVEIVSGTSTTDETGGFDFTFKALPDEALTPESNPLHDYVIECTVTDINGEVRSITSIITIGYKSFTLQANIPEAAAITQFDSLKIFTKNLNQEFEPTALSVKITRLQSPERLIRARYWSRPDVFVMNKEEYLQHFPWDEYDNETDKQSWGKTSLVYAKKDSAAANGLFKIDNSKLTPGSYLIEYTATNKKGETVSGQQVATLFDASGFKHGDKDYLYSKAMEVAHPGEKAVIDFRTNADDLFVIKNVRTNDADKFNPEYFTLNNEHKKFEISIREIDRGGVVADILFVKHNRVFSKEYVINVPWSNKNLNIEYITYRDKTQPGSKEDWKIKVNAEEKGAFPAELVATIYDASLDQMKNHSYDVLGIWGSGLSNHSWDVRTGFSQESFWDEVYHSGGHFERFAPFEFDRYDPYLADSRFGFEDMVVAGRRTAIKMSALSKEAPVNDMASPMQGEAAGMPPQEMLMKAEEPYQDGVDDKKQQAVEQIDETSGIKPRSNFNETAFFAPQLLTDAKGNLEFSFTLPESLTKWKFLAFAHNKQLAMGVSSKEFIAQKKLMVQPNLPRFLREGDYVELSTKLVNISENEISGKVHLLLFDAETMAPVDGAFQSSIADQFFTIAAGSSEAVSFPVTVPYRFGKPLLYKIIAQSGVLSDGEENYLPILTNRVLVTKTLPMYMNELGKKDYNFQALLQSGSEATIEHRSLTVEYTTDPSWYVIQALPYLMENPGECSEQVWSRFYANTLAGHIINSSAKIKEVFQKWKITDTAALISNLEKNQELKNFLLEETPWVLDAKNETEQKKSLALLFDIVKLQISQTAAITKLQEQLNRDGGFSWFKGGYSNRCITLAITEGIARLKELKTLTPQQWSQLKPIVQKTVPYLDAEIKKDYDDLVKYKSDLKNYTPNSLQVHYLYMRRLFTEMPVPANIEKIHQYFLSRLKATWTQQSNFTKGYAAMLFKKVGDETTAGAILKSLKEYAIINEELGAYWKANSMPWQWYGSGLDQQALMIEVFQKLSPADKGFINNLKVWLLKNKQTNNWGNTRSTANACYALMLSGEKFEVEKNAVSIQIGNEKINLADEKTEAATGYFKKQYAPQDVKPDMGKISITSAQTTKNAINWGAVYWQYFDDIKNITAANTGLKVAKKIFKEMNTASGPVLREVAGGDILKVGDRVVMRIILETDRELEYVHLKDLRAASFEPVDVLSSYRWQDRLGYYQSVKDASVSFFFDRLPKGKYVFDYKLNATAAGTFTNGFATLQCLYAPEFNANSASQNVVVEK